MRDSLRRILEWSISYLKVSLGAMIFAAIFFSIYGFINTHHQIADALSAVSTVIMTLFALAFLLRLTTTMFGVTPTTVHEKLDELPRTIARTIEVLLYLPTYMSILILRSKIDSDPINSEILPTERREEAEQRSPKGRPTK